MFFHHFEQVYGTNYVVFVVEHWEIVALAYCLFGCKVHYTIYWLFFLLVALEKVI